MTSLDNDKQWIIISELTSTGNIDGVRSVIEAWGSEDSDKRGLLLGLLLDTLPEVQDPATYTEFILSIIRGSYWKNEGTKDMSESQSFPEVYLDVSSWPAEIISEYGKEIRSRSSQTLETCKDPRTSEELTFWWFKSRALRVDHELGNLDLVIEILSNPRLPSSLHEWSSAFPCVLRNWQNYYGFVEMTIDEFNHLSASDAVDFLLSKYESSQSDLDPHADILLRDLTTLVLPYIAYTGADKQLWDHLYEYCKSHITCASILAQSWKIPKPQEPGYAKCMIRLCYTYAPPEPVLDKTKGTAWESMEIIVKRLGEISPAPPSATNFLPDLGGDYPYVGLLDSNGGSVELLSTLVKSGKLLSQCDFADSLLPIVRLRFFADEHTQFMTLRRFLSAGANKVPWKDIRNQLFWLKDTGKVFGNISSLEIETAFLRSLLDAKEFKLLREMYVDVPQPPLNRDILESEILTEFGEYFNNATSLSSKSGGVKDALSTIMVLNAPLSSSPPLIRAFNLVDAMDSLSRFNLNKNGQGDELLPVQIRSMEDPLDVFNIVFRNDHKAYLRHQELINVAHKLLIGLDRDEYRNQVDIRITALCVQSALEANAFPVALRLCEDALIPLHNDNKEETDPMMVSGQNLIYETCYNVGYYGHGDKKLAISVLEDELSLLARALSIVPPKELDRFLNLWLQVEQQIRERSYKETHEPQVSRNKKTQLSHDRFLAADVARALTSSASAFVDHTSRGGLGQQKENTTNDETITDDAPWKKSFLPNINSHEIKDKKDHLSNLFASGIGWAIGATPREN